MKLNERRKSKDRSSSRHVDSKKVVSKPVEVTKETNTAKTKLSRDKAKPIESKDKPKMAS